MSSGKEPVAKESPRKYHLIKGDWMYGLLIFLRAVHMDVSERSLRKGTFKEDR